MERPRFCRLLLCVIVCLGASFGWAATPPNLIVIMADDLGYETIGANGGTSYPTPALDRLAADGVRFTHCYAQPLCTPTRVQLMTGMSNRRNYIRFGVLDPQATTFAQVLRQAGYATGIVGKWQLGQEPDLPQRVGFDESCLWQHTRRPPRYANAGLEVNGEERDHQDGEYGPTLVNDYALDFITRHREHPFLLYYPMILTHSPYQPTPDSESWDPTLRSENKQKSEKHFGEMVRYMDKMVGRVVERLEQLKLRDRTLIVFLGDNGTGKGTVSWMGETKVVGGKGTTTRAGMHVPLIASWPGSIARGMVSDELVDTTDFFPTFCEAAGVPIPDNLTIDGTSFLGVMQGQGNRYKPLIYTWYSPRQNNDRLSEYVFNRQYKLYTDGRFYDLLNDSLEKAPLEIGTLTGAAKLEYQELQKSLDRWQTVPSRPD